MDFGLYLLSELNLYGFLHGGEVERVDCWVVGSQEPVISIAEALYDGLLAR
jgi:hypothetical protein